MNKKTRIEAALGLYRGLTGDSRGADETIAVDILTDALHRFGVGGIHRILHAALGHYVTEAKLERALAIHVSLDGSPVSAFLRRLVGQLNQVDQESEEAGGVDTGELLELLGGIRDDARSLLEALDRERFDIPRRGA